MRGVKKRLADGSVATYYYDRTTGAALGTDLAIAVARATPVQAPAAGRPRSGTLASMIAEYRAGPAFMGRRPSTREMYGRILNWLRDEFGEVPLTAITPGRIERLKDSLQATPHKANHTVAILRLVLRHAVRRGYITHNPADKLGKIATTPRKQVWTHEDTARIFDGLRPSVRLAGMLMAYTLQRLSDVLAMTTIQVRDLDGRLWINLRQAKTTALIAVPVHQDLEPLLRDRLAERKVRKTKDEDAVVLLLVPSPQGMPWARRNFSRAWDLDLRRANLRLARELLRDGWSKDKVRAELQARHRQRRDLRRTGVVRLAEAGATVPQIAAVAGWSIDYTQKIVDTYLPRRSEVALAGIEAWEQRGTGTDGRVVRLADRRK